MNFLLTPTPAQITIPLTDMQTDLQDDAMLSGKSDLGRIFRTRLGGGLSSAALLVAALLVLSAGLPLAHAANHHHHPSKQVVQTIARLERKWLAAQLTANVSVMSNMLAEDYLGISPNGTLESKSETLANYTNGVMHFMTMTTSERKIRVYGSTAVVTSQAEVVGTRDGASMHGRYRYTRVYHNEGNTWKIVSFEASKIRDNKKLSHKIPSKN